MQQFVEQIKKTMHFKATAAEGDILLVCIEKPQSVFFARIAEISRDTSKKDEWWHVSLDILSVPPQKATWTLREPQFTGKEIFTMGGEGRFMAPIDFDHDHDEKTTQKTPSSSKKSAKITPLRPVKKS